MSDNPFDSQIRQLNRKYDDLLDKIKLAGPARDLDKLSNDIDKLPHEIEQSRSQGYTFRLIGIPLNKPTIFPGNINNHGNS